MGEYARSATLARAIAQRWPAASLHFLLSRAAPYACAVPFPTTWLEASATFHTPEVLEVLRTFRPQVVIFDNAGRTSQLEAAHRLGARVIYVSSRRRQRAKAFRLRWMRLLDEHWIAYPRLIAGDLRLLERAKLRLLGRPIVRYLDVVMARPAPGRAAPLLAEAGLEGPFILVVPGGGTGARGARGALERFEHAAVSLAARGIAVLYAGRPTGTVPAALKVRPDLPQADLAALMGRAEVVLVNGGSTLLQAIACGAPCVACGIAGDQHARIRRCVAAGLALSAPLDAESMAERCAALFADAPARAALRARAAQSALADGVEIALGALARYIS